MRPSYATGFARYAADSKYPELWRGLVGAWCPFLGNTGPDLLRDVSGHHNHGTLNGPTWMPGKDGPALEFPGSSEYVNVTTSPTLDITEITVSAWVNFDSFGSYNMIVAKRDDTSSAGRWNFDQRNSGKLNLGFYVSGWHEWLTDNVVLSTNQWIHIIVTFDSINDAIIYVDGQPQPASRSGDITSFPTNNFPLKIGAMGGNPSLFFDGKISNVLIYNRALSAAEVAWLYREPYAMFEYADIPYAIAPVAANDLLLLTQSNLRGNLHILSGGLR